MNKIFFISGAICSLCALVGWSRLNVVESEQNVTSGDKEITQEVNLTHWEKPPSLTITFGKKEIRTIQGGYSWSYLDSKTGQTVDIQADFMPSTELVNIEDAVNVSLNEPIILNFEKEPLNYEIRVYDNIDKMIATYFNFKDVEEKGKAKYEILATWEEGTGSYVVALDI
ncbi:hypothetical protein [Lysinibacillus halotolerans]|uniref:Uncharacterized protein n=1 Tax=Lysinibacillus halotolerans TaxID=1368476 RepID=A0A3M8H657_9BACI|nr:hypothetical protein [Lysinibacillus halotolerans]RNC97895.1 hypothetical protein EC501_13070 [Lysinibacillus halotolerans]